MKPCEVCNGTRRVECFTCEGDGFDAAWAGTCKKCEGSGKVPCPECEPVEDRPEYPNTRYGRLQAAADRGFDTWDDLPRGEMTFGEAIQIYGFTEAAKMLAQALKAKGQSK